LANPVDMNEKDCIFNNLEHIADAIVTLFGKNCEACVHDLTSLQNSLTYIQGDVTNRKPGAPATDMLLKMIRQNNGSGKNPHSYKTITSDGRSLKSTTTFFRDSAGKPVAAFCINFDTTEFYNASKALMPFASIEENSSTASTETFAHSIGETITALFSAAVEEIGKHPATMNVQEKTQLITILEEHGTFQLKSAVEQIAPMMGVTKYTVYNYLKKVRTCSNKKKKTT
jgi:predicted transcriptional regulator YheO